MVAALLLAGLFFRFGVEQRLGEIGLLRAVGVSEARVRRLFLAEAAVLSGLGALLGIGGAVAYAWLMMHGLRTVWVDAVGTRRLELALGAPELALGALGGDRGGARGRGSDPARAARALGAEPARPRPRAIGPRRTARGAARGRSASRSWPGCCSAPPRSVCSAARPRSSARARCCSARACSLVSAWLSGDRRRAATAATAGVAALGFRQAAFRPGRSVLAVALVAFASFVIVSVGAFRHSGPPDTGPHSETGGFALIARSVLPLHHDPAPPKDERRSASTACPNSPRRASSASA